MWQGRARKEMRTGFLWESLKERDLPKIGEWMVGLILKRLYRSSRAITFCTVAPSIFSIITAVLLFTHKMCII